MNHVPSSSQQSELFPGTLYFNGIAMPQWAQCWVSCGLLELAQPVMKSWDERITSQDLWILWCRMDHTGVAESEDPVRFRVLGLLLLQLVLVHKQAVLSSLLPLASEYGAPLEEIQQGVVDGLFQMTQLAAEQRIAFWTTGEESDRQMLLETIRRCRLPVGDPQHLEAPHLRHDQSEAELRVGFLTKELRTMSNGHELPKAIRVRIQRL